MPGTEWNLLFAADVNDAGQIAALAFNTVSGQSATLRLTPSETTQPATMHVADVTVTLHLRGRGGSGVASVAVADDSGAAVAGATVVGDWLLNGSVFQTGRTAVTGTDGRAQLRSDKIGRMRSGDVLAFCVTGVSHSAFAYNQGANVESCSQAVVP